MRIRAFGSILVVVAGLLPVLAGGLPFTALMVLIALVGYQEFCDLTLDATASGALLQMRIAAFVLVALAIAASVAPTSAMLIALIFFGIAAQLTAILPNVDRSGAFVQWALASIGMIYVGLPVIAATVLRSLPGLVDTSWLARALDATTGSWLVSTRGLAWTLLTVLVIWINDTAAYLVGRAIGRRKLAPRISPGKTVEGAIGGLVGAVLTAGTLFPLFGLGPAWIGLFVGAVIGVMGQLGDLCESFIKRQAGRKDSGSVIPGHGGLLDRVDALMFAFPTSLFLASLLERAGIP